MKPKYLLLILALMLCLGVKAEVISIETSGSSIVLKTTKDGQLLFLHYGGKILNPASLDSYKSYQRSDYNMEPQAYPAAGGRYFNEPALSIVHSTGALNTELRYRSHSTAEIDPGVIRTEILLVDDLAKVDVRLVYDAYQKEDVIVCHSEISNLGRKPLTLENYYSSAINLEAGSYLLTHFYGSWAREMQLCSEALTPGTKIIETKKGVRTTHTENPSFVLSLNAGELSETAGEVVAGALAWTGNYRLLFQVDESNRLNILAGINPYESARSLAKGETFTTPEMIYTYSAEGAGRASRNLHSWARRHHIYQGLTTMCPTLLNSWEGAYFDFNASVLTGMIDSAAELGLEMFVLDDGWFANKYPRDNDKQGLGDWQTNVKKLPEGIDYIASYAHDKGLKFGIWIEPEMVNPKSELAEKHPDWVVKEDGREIPTMRSQWLLDLSNPKVQDFVYDVFDQTMQLSPSIDYIKWDANRHVESVGSAYLKDQKEFWTKYVEGFYSVMERIRAKYPDVMVQACSSGGGRVDYGALRYFNEVWTSDNTESLSRIFIQWGTNMIYPASVTGSHVSAVPNHQTQNITPIKFRFDVASAGRLGMELNPATMTDEEKAYARRAIASYKSFRDLVFYGDLYRICSPYEGNHSCIMYVNEEKTRAVVMAYCIKYQSRTLKTKFRLQGLDPEKNYKVKELNVDKSCWWGNGKIFKGSELMNFGMNPDMTKIYNSAIFLIEEER